MARPETDPGGTPAGATGAPSTGTDPGPPSPALMIDVEVCWVEADAAAASPARPVRWRLSVPSGSNVGQVLQSLNRPEWLAGLGAGRLTVALFGEHASATTVLREGDRIELLEGLIADPRQSRARRAKAQRRRLGDARWQPH